MTRIGRKTLWLMVFIGFIAALVVFFAVATSGFKNWNGNEWFDYWGQGKPVTTSVSNDKDKPVAQNAMRLNNSRSDEAITIPRYLLKTTTQKSYVNTSGKVQLNPRFLFSSKPETYDDYNYIVSFEFSKLSQYKVGATQFSITFCCNSYNFLDLSVSFNILYRTGRPTSCARTVPVPTRYFRRACTPLYFHRRNTLCIRRGGSVGYGRLFHTLTDVSACAVEFPTVWARLYCFLWL